MIYILTKTTSVTSLADIQMGTQLTADFEILATSRPVLEEVIEKLNLDYTYEELKSMIQTDNQTDTRILRFTVSDANAKEAKKIANELADVTAERVAYVMSSDKPKVVERQGKKDHCCNAVCDSSLLCGVSDLVLRYVGKDEAVV